MALTQTIQAITKMEDGQKGLVTLSLNEWTTTSAPSISSGSVIEVGNSIFKATADQNMDADSILKFAAVPAASLIYAYINSSGGCEISVTDIPVWDDAKQGWYGSVTTTNRSYAIVYKDASSAYIMKHILIKRSYDYITGMVAAFPLSTVKGWLRCNGATISLVTNPDYAHLILMLKSEAGADATHPFYHADADKAKLPDLDGRVIRGIDNVSATRDQDGVRKAGNYQVDGNKLHGHTIQIPNGAGGTACINAGAANYTPSAYSNIVNSSGNTEATMKNVSLYFMIKY